MEIILLKAVSCRWCARIFFICLRCWRGQAYCCDACRQASQREAHCLAQKIYRQTAKGREPPQQTYRLYDCILYHKSVYAKGWFAQRGHPLDTVKYDHVRRYNHLPLPVNGSRRSLCLQINYIISKRWPQLSLVGKTWYKSCVLPISTIIDNSTASCRATPNAIGPYSQAIIIGDLVFTSGQLPINPATGKITEGTITDQTHQALKNLSAVILGAGGTLDDVVKTTVYLQNISDFQEVNWLFVVSSGFEQITNR